MNFSCIQFAWSPERFMCVCAHNSWLIRPDMSDMEPATLRLFFPFFFRECFHVHLFIYWFVGGGRKESLLLMLCSPRPCRTVKNSTRGVKLTGKSIFHFIDTTSLRRRLAIIFLPSRLNCFFFSSLPPCRLKTPWASGQMCTKIRFCHCNPTKRRRFTIKSSFNPDKLLSLDVRMCLTDFRTVRKEGRLRNISAFSETEPDESELKQ